MGTNGSELGFEQKLWQAAAKSQNRETFKEA
jgi:hypothetical protein